MHLPLQVCQALTTSTEFLEWEAFFEEEMNRPSKEDWYLAQIACETRKTFSKNPEKYKTEQFLMKFHTRQEDASASGMTSEERRAAKTATSKKAWFATLGMKDPTTSAN